MEIHKIHPKEIRSWGHILSSFSPSHQLHELLLFSGRPVSKDKDQPPYRYFLVDIRILWQVAWLSRNTSINRVWSGRRLSIFPHSSLRPQERLRPVSNHQVCVSGYRHNPLKPLLETISLGQHIVPPCLCTRLSCIMEGWDLVHSLHHSG